MGCAGSKPAEDQPAVALCKQRCLHLQEAINHRYDFAHAHAEYLLSLRTVGDALSAFFLAEPGNPGASPVLTLPEHYKAKGVAVPPVGNPIPPLSPPAKPQPVPIAAAAANHQHSRSNSGSHLHFMDSESDSDDGPLHSDHGTPYYQHPPKNNPYDAFPAMNTTTTTYFNFAKKAAPAAVTYEQRPYDLASVQVGTFGSSGGDPPTAYPYYNNADQYSNNPSNYYGAGASSSASSFPFSYPYQYPAPYGSSGGGGAGGGGFFDPSPSQTTHAGAGSSSSSAGPRAPPPPPSPPKASPWDFINVFDSYDSYYPNNFTPSRSSRDLREEEGIPELEEEDQEVIKQAYVQAKSVGDAPPKPSDEGPRRSVGQDVHYKMGSVPENEVAQAADKSAAAGGNAQKQEEAFKRNIVPGSRSVPDTVHLVKDMFFRSSMAAEEVHDVLELGKVQYHQRKYQVVSSKLMRPIMSPVSVFSSSLASTAVSSEESDSASSLPSKFGELESKTLSCILHKLLIWETKLLDEVKAEEDMQLLLEKNKRKLRRLDDKGAEASKIDATRKAVKSLSTRIKVAIQVVETISNKINMLRDGELWIELQKLIQGLVKIWKAMAECHRVQCQAIIESRSLDVVTVRLLSDAQSEAITQLVVALHRWSVIFSSWVSAQKFFVQSLNEWLRTCIRDEPVDTVDGPAPFSPGRLGAPPVFVICNNWAQALAMISELEVVHAMASLKATMKHIWDWHCNQIALVSRPGDRRLKEIETKRQKLHRELGEAPSKKQGQLVAEVSQAIEPGNLKSNLQQVFEAMERFTDNSTRAYEGLWASCVEENRPRENAGPS